MVEVAMFMRRMVTFGELEVQAVEARDVGKGVMRPPFPLTATDRRQICSQKLAMELCLPGRWTKCCG